MLPIVASPAAAESYLWAIVLFPLAGAIVNGLAGRRLGKGNVALVAVGAMVGALAVSTVAFAWTLQGLALHFRGDPWFRIVGPAPEARTLVSIGWGLAVDRLSATMIMVVTGVGTLIHVYSISYMSHEDDAGFARYFAFLNLFAAAMLTLVLADTLVLTFVGWEGVGLCSYLLIGFWYTDPQKAFAGRKAFVTNRIGDFGFLLGVFALFSIFGTSSYEELAGMARQIDPASVIRGGLFSGMSFQTAITLALVGLFVGACGKSAQLPLYVWLPDAMAGPTPVSALIHAATMVTAGVYLVARNSYLFALAPAAMATVTIVGAATALFAALIAFVQTDIKKVLAYSTVSQLGFMFVGVGSGAFWAGILHLVTHAFFKGCLFLGAGSVMHGMGDETDVRKMGGLWRKMPITALTFGVATLAITGFVPLSGFWSKDAILGGALFSHNPAWGSVGLWAYGLGTAAALGTAFYMSRLYFLTFVGKPRTPAAEHAHESSPVMTVPLLVLALLAIVALVLALPGEGQWSMVYEHFMAPVFQPATTRLLAAKHFELGGEPPWPYLVAWGVAAAGTAVAWTMYAGPALDLPERLARRFPALYRFTWEKFRVDELYEALVLRPVRFLAYALWRVLDVFAVDGVLVNGVARLVALVGRVVRVFQDGDVQRYAALMAVAAAVILWSVMGAGGGLP